MSSPMPTSPSAIDVCIDRYDPDIIFTHHPFDTHQAHAGVSNATIAAVREAAAGGLPLSTIINNRAYYANVELSRLFG